MSERLPSAQEQDAADKKELLLEGREQQEKLRENREANAERAHEQDTDKANEAVKEALAESQEKEKVARVEKVEKKRAPKRSKKARDESFNKQLSAVRPQMAAPSRAFSKVIHTKPVEKTSEAVGATIARPNALLAGSVTAFLLTSGVYFWAKHVGYPLSGFETIGAFIIGWLVGILFDFTRIMVTGKS